MLIIANHPLPGDVIRADENMKMISVAFVGIDHVDVEACKEKGVLISNTGGYCNDAVAELAGEAGGTVLCLCGPGSNGGGFRLQTAQLMLRRVV